jgi:hypothetical protein
MEGRGVRLRFGVFVEPGRPVRGVLLLDSAAIQERLTGEGVEGSVEAACLASASASPLPGMAVCPGTQWTVMVELVLLMSLAISWMSRAVSCPGPWVRCVACVIAA